MKKIPVPLDKAYRLIGFGPLILVSSFDGKKGNIMPVAWNMPVNHGPTQVAVCIGDHSYTHQTVLKTKEFVINVPSAKIIQKVYGCGKCSGRDVNKFEKFELTPLPAKEVAAPLIEECLAHLECKVIDDSLVEKFNLFIVEAKAAWANEGVLEDVFQIKNQPLHHLGGNNFMIPGRVFRTQK